MNRVSPARRITIPPASARAFSVARGETLRIIDVEGGQPGDLVAFNDRDLSEWFSQARTRVENRSVTVTAGHRLWSNAQPPAVMFTITEDTAGGHDLLYTPCCRYALEKRFHVSRDGCLENLVRALSPWGLTERNLPDPLNLFFHVGIAENGGMTILPAPSRAGDYVALGAEMDCLIAVAACAVPRAKKNSGYLVQISA